MSKAKKTNKKNRPRPAKASKASKPDGDLWIAPRYSLKGPAGERAWENRVGGPPQSSKYLELADIAMGVKKPEAAKKPGEIHDRTKKEPYSNSPE